MAGFAKHQIAVLHHDGMEAIVLSFRVNRLFNPEAYRIFDDEAQHCWANMHKVNDRTLAGYHYSNDNGTVVLELR